MQAGLHQLHQRSTCHDTHSIDSHPGFIVRGVCWHCHVYSLYTPCLHISSPCKNHMLSSAQRQTRTHGLSPKMQAPHASQTTYLTRGHAVQLSQLQHPQCQSQPIHQHDTTHINTDIRWEHFPYSVAHLINMTALTPRHQCRQVRQLS
jgi:hypothetical protein